MEELAMDFQDVYIEGLESFNPKIEPGEWIVLAGKAEGTARKLCQGIMNMRNLERGEIKIFRRDHRTGEGRAKLLLGYVGPEVTFFRDQYAETLARWYSRFFPAWENERWESLKGKLSINNKEPVEKWKEDEKIRFQLALALARKAEVLILSESSRALVRYKKLFSPKQTVIVEGTGADKWVKEAGRVFLFRDDGFWFGGSKQELEEKMRRVRLEESLGKELREKFFWDYKALDSGGEGLTFDYPGLEKTLSRPVKMAKKVDPIEVVRQVIGGKK